MNQIIVERVDVDRIYLLGGHSCTWAEAREAAVQCQIPCWPHEWARQEDPEGAALEDVYRDVLRQARALRPPERRLYHDPCRHDEGFCRPIEEFLDPDDVEVEALSRETQRRLNREIDTLREEVTP